jgi:cell division transport system permease protein
VPGVATIYSDPTVANAMSTIRNVLSIVSACIAAVLLIVSLIIISNTIKLAMFDRREEIAIMRMVGATNGFIRLPFVVEGFILGLLGAVCSFFLEWGLYEAIRGAIASSGQLSFLHVVSFSTVALPVALVCVVTGLLIGVVGSLMSIRKFLKV